MKTKNSNKLDVLVSQKSVNNIDIARAKILQICLENFKDTTFSDYIEKNLAGDFACEIANYITSLEVSINDLKSSPSVIGLDSANAKMEGILDEVSESIANRVLVGYVNEYELFDNHPTARMMNESNWEPVYRSTVAVKDGVQLLTGPADGFIDEFGTFESILQPWMLEEPNVAWYPVYKAGNLGLSKISTLDLIESLNFEAIYVAHSEDEIGVAHTEYSLEIEDLDRLRALIEAKPAAEIIHLKQTLAAIEDGLEASNALTAALHETEILDLQAQVSELRQHFVDLKLISSVVFRPDDGFPLCDGYMVGSDDGKSTLYPTPKCAVDNVIKQALLIGTQKYNALENYKNRVIDSHINAQDATKGISPPGSHYF